MKRFLLVFCVIGIWGACYSCISECRFERMGDELMPVSLYPEWYRITKKGLKKIKTPKQYEKVCNFSIG